MLNIPKIIHQVWWQGEKYIPEKYNEYRNIIIKMNPEYEYKLWSEINFLNLIQNDDVAMKKYYKFEYMIQKFDYMKLYILNKFGGIFIDIDSYSMQNMDKLLDMVKDYDFICSYIKDLDSIGSYFMCGKLSECCNQGNLIAKANNDFLEYLMENLETNCDDFIDKRSCVTSTTGPTKFNELLDSYKTAKRNNLKSNIKILNYEYLEPCFYDDCNISNNTYIVHKHNGGWLNSTTLSFIKFYLKDPYLIYIVLFMIIIYGFFGVKNIYNN